jgi:hypothetical protein
MFPSFPYDYRQQPGAFGDDPQSSRQDHHSFKSQFVGANDGS